MAKKKKWVKRNRVPKLTTRCAVQKNFYNFDALDGQCAYVDILKTYTLQYKGKA